MDSQKEMLEREAATIQQQQNKAAKRWAIRGVLKFAFLAVAVAVGVYIGVSLAT